MRIRIKKITGWLAITAVLWVAAVAAMIWRYGLQDHAAKSDCIIVLGAAVQGDGPSPVFAERIRHGVHLYQAGYAPVLIFTGGFGSGQTHSEGAVGQAAAIRQGVPAQAVLIEQQSRTTQQNLSEAAALMRQHGLKSAIVVSDPLHLKRAIAMAGGQGIAACSSPTPTTRYRSLKARLGFLFREVYFLHHYFFTGS